LLAFAKQRISTKLGKNKPSIKDLLNIIFGPTGKLGCLFNDNLCLSSEELAQMLAVFFLSLEYNLSKTQNFGKQSMVDTEGLVSSKEYQEFWNNISNSGMVW
jgi:hypothetical protein